jgi:hypothetical protein
MGFSGLAGVTPLESAIDAGIAWGMVLWTGASKIVDEFPVEPEDLWVFRSSRPNKFLKKPIFSPFYIIFNQSYLPI